MLARPVFGLLVSVISFDIDLNHSTRATQVPETCRVDPVARRGGRAVARPTPPHEVDCRIQWMRQVDSRPSDPKVSDTWPGREPPDASLPACGERCHRQGRGGPCIPVGLEAAPGFEPGIKDLQSSALPLGHAALGRPTMYRNREGRSSPLSSLQSELASMRHAPPSASSRRKVIGVGIREVARRKNFTVSVRRSIVAGSWRVTSKLPASSGSRR